MPALNATLQVASLVKSSSIPYIEKLAKVAVAVIELLEVPMPPLPVTILASDFAASIEESKNKEDVKELCESITNTVDVIKALVSMHGEQGAAYLKDICMEMEGYLAGIAQDLEGAHQKYRSFKGFFNVNEFWDAILGYGKCVDDLKMDFLIHVTGDSMLALIEIHCILANMQNVKKTALQEESLVTHIQVPIPLHCFTYHMPELPPTTTTGFSTIAPASSLSHP